MTADDFYVCMMRAIAWGVVALVAVVGGCTAHRNALIADAMRNGVDPIAVMCALDGIDRANTPICIAFVAKK